MMLLLALLPLIAEIETVTISWDPVQCKSGCIRLLEQQVSRNPSINQYEINASGGEATFAWRPYRRFDYVDFRKTLQRVGIPLGVENPPLIKARGTIHKQGGDYVFRSLGDRTEFVLLSSYNPNEPRRARGNPKAYTLEGKLLDLVKQGANRDLVAEIVGTFYNPNYTSSYLNVQRITYPNKLSID